MQRLLALAVATGALALPAAAHADAPPPGSKWTQASITEADGTKLHADVLRPANLAADAKTPVILSIGPYFNHSGQTGPVGPIEDTPYTPVGDAGPSARFYDRYVKGDAVADSDPPNAVESSDGTWRSETAWPPADSQKVTRALRTGSYQDDAQNNGTAEGGSPNGQGIWTISPPLAADAHFAGVPRVTVDAEPARADANLVADVYDIDSGRNATLIRAAPTSCAGRAR